MSREHQFAAEYVAALSAELAEIARRHGLDTSAYMLEMAAAAAHRAPDTDKGPQRPSGGTSRSARIISLR
jgi:hypothetical protein